MAVRRLQAAFSVPWTARFKHWTLPCRRFSAGLKEQATSLSPISPPTPPDKSDHHSKSSPDAHQAGWLGMDMPWHKPSKEVLLVPCDYMAGLPSKQVCTIAADMFNEWTKVPQASIHIIKKTMKLLQDSLLMLDDIQDNSPIRRGKPAVHTIFGCAQALNGSSFMTIQALQQVRLLKSDAAIDIFLDEIETIYLGQSLDNHWKFHLQCPTEEEYMHMVDSKSGPFFRVIARLLQAEAVAYELSTGTGFSFDRLTTLLGRFYQLRDDYMNLRSSVYASKKGSCEDLDEGKFSYPVVHCLINSPAYRSHILGIFRQRPTAPGVEPSPLSPQAKSHLLSCLEDSGAMKATLERILEFEAELEAEFTRLESITGWKNPALRALLKKLSLANGHEHTKD